MQNDLRERMAIELRRFAQVETASYHPWAEIGQESKDHWMEEADRILALLPTSPEAVQQGAPVWTEKLDALYNAECNVRISSFFDAGYTVEVGDAINGIKAVDQCLYGLESAVNRLWEMAQILHPDIIPPAPETPKGDDR